MGEMADYYTDDMYLDEDYDWPAKTCKYCGDTELYWVETENGWRLADFDGKIHNCKKYKPLKDKQDDQTKTRLGK